MFHLVKRYLDAIDVEGNSWIVYFAHLKIGPIRLSFSSVLFADQNGEATEESSLQKVSLPEIGPTMKIQNGALQIEGTWTCNQPEIEKDLWQDEQGKILNWHCHQPSSDVWLTFKGKQFNAKGYAETLTLPFSPLKLPLERLRWGRFISGDLSIIWIQWEGKHPLNFVWVNGVEITDAIHSDSGFTFDSGSRKIEFLNPIIIRNGKLGTVIQKYPLLKYLFPKNLLRSEELKLKSETIYSSQNEMPVRGWSLYETVQILN
ncbi:MAG TPA: hypothetical protein PK509_11030 [Catalimonadaceae bacterium]|nr:hypothetical protein [Catalimonadaceae bacterium]